MKARSIFHIILASCCLIAVYQPVSAQITPDDTLSTERSRVIPQNSSTERIEGGARRGANLFHSFQEFNVDQGRGAYFANPAGVENILSRVTGGNPSEILGTLGVLEGNANLFFLNPNGIIFGSNTKLDVRGSFLGSTSDSFIFDNGFVFSAANPQSPPLLTISVPVGLQFGRNPGAIRFLGTSGFQSSRHGLGLTVPPGRTVALVGGEMTLQGAFLGAPGGRIEIGSVAPLSQIRLHSADGGWRLGYEGSQGFQNIEVSRSLIDTSVRANNNFQLLSSDGDISIRASNLDIGGTSIVRASTFTALPGGDITIDVENLTLREGANVVSVAFDRGKAGNLTVNASESITLTGAIDIGSFISPTLLAAGSNFLFSQSTGDGGALTINTRRLLLQNGAAIRASSETLGAAGSLTVNASESVRVIGSFSELCFTTLTTQTQGSGRGGTLTINTPTLLIEGGAQVSSGTFGEGEGGNLTVNASDSVQLIGTSADNRTPSGLFASTEGPGAAGNLTITTRQLLIQDGAVASAGTRGDGQGGSLTVHASGSVKVIGTSANGQFGSRLLASATSTGAAGHLTINTRQLLVRDGAQVSSGTFGEGVGGSVTVHASDSVQLIGTAPEGRFPSGLFASTEGIGAAGDLTITTQQLLISDGAEVTVSSIGSNSGEVGNLALSTNSIQLDNSRITGQTDSGNGGNFQLHIEGLLLLRNGSEISTTAGSAQAGGDGGNITIDTDFIVAIPSEDSDITANAFNGRGGNINITTQGIYGLEFREELTPLSDITASSQFGVDGELQLNLLTNVDPTQGLATLPTNVIDPSQKIAQSCTPRGEQASRFVATGRGGLPLSPDEPLRGRAVVPLGWVTLDGEAQTSAHGRQERGDEEIDAVSSSPTEIVEADGWVVDAKGNVVLVAHFQIPNPVQSPIAPASCPN